MAACDLFTDGKVPGCSSRRLGNSQILDVSLKAKSTKTNLMSKSKKRAKFWYIYITFLHGLRATIRTDLDWLLESYFAIQGGCGHMWQTWPTWKKFSDSLQTISQRIPQSYPPRICNQSWNRLRNKKVENTLFAFRKFLNLTQLIRKWTSPKKS